MTIPITKKTIYIMFLSVFQVFLFGCKEAKVKKDDLIGVWLGEKHNGAAITGQGFNSIRLTFANDSVEVFVDMKAFGGKVTTKSTGPWQLNNNIIKTKFGDHEQECVVILNKKTKRLTFKPDLFFKPESILTSEYKKDQ